MSGLFSPIAEFKKYPQKKWQCHLCSYHGWEAAKYSHLAVNHEVFLKNKLTCDVCGKVLWQKCHLRNHMRVHTEDKPFKW